MSEEEERLETDAAIRDLAARAAALLREEGWCQGDFQREDGSRCLAGAVLDAKRDIDVIRTSFGLPSRDVRFMLLDRLRRITGRSLLVAWNDDEDRTAAEVIAALERAASGG